MVDRIPSDHRAVETVRATLERIGRTGRPRVVIPEGTPIPTDETVRLSLSGTAYHAFVTTDLRDRVVIRGAFDNPRLARNPEEGENRLAAWVEDERVPEDGPVLLDAVTEGVAYGLRAPGDRVVYDAIEGPADSLAAIAEDVSDRTE